MFIIIDFVKILDILLRWRLYSYCGFEIMNTCMIIESIFWVYVSFACMENVKIVTFLCWAMGCLKSMNGQKLRVIMKIMGRLEGIPTVQWLETRHLLISYSSIVSHMKAEAKWFYWVYCVIRLLHTHCREYWLSIYSVSSSAPRATYIYISIYFTL